MNEQISEDRVLEVLFRHIPEFKTLAESELDEEDCKLGYIVAGSFARFLLDSYKENKTQILKSAAEFIEELYIKGNDKVKELATIGYLEGIQNVWGNNDTEPAIYYEYLLPESRKWWNQLNKFWNAEVKYVGETISQEP